MRAVKLFGKVFAVILSCMFACFLLLVMYVLIAKTMLTEESIYNSIVDTEIFSYSSGTENGNLRQSTISDLKKFGIPVSVTDRVLDSDDIDRIISKYVYDYTRYVLYNEGTSGLSSDDIINIFNKEYNSSTGKYLTDKQINYLKKYISSVEYKFGYSVPSLGDLQSNGVDVYKLRIVSGFISSDYTWVLCLIFIVSFYTLIAICLWDKLRAFKWIGFINIVDGLLLIISSFLEVRLLSMFINKNGIFENLAITVASKNFEFLLIAGIVLIVLGILFLIICALLMKKEHKVDSDKLLDSVIKEEVSLMNSDDDKIDKYDDVLESTDDVISEKEYVDDIDKVILDDVSDALPVSDVSVVEGDDVPVVRINGNDNEIDSTSLIEAVKIDESIDDNVEDSDVSDDVIREDVEVNSDDKDIEESNDTDDKENDNVIEDDEQIVVSCDNDDTDESDDIDDNKIDEEVELDSDSDEDESDIEDKDDENVEYEEIDDSDLEIKKHDIDVLVPESVSLSVVTPKRGKDIEPDLVEILDDEEDIELL